MIDTHELKRRNLYLDKLKAFQDTEPVKVITGIKALREIQPAQAHGGAFEAERHYSGADWSK